MVPVFCDNLCGYPFLFGGASSGGMLMVSPNRSKPRTMVIALIMVAVVALPLAVYTFQAPSAYAATTTFPARGNLDCNGFSKIQRPLRRTNVCTDFVGY